MSASPTRTQQVSPGQTEIPIAPFDRELARIRDAYHRRKTTVPRGRYAAGNPCQSLALEELENEIFVRVAAYIAYSTGISRVLDIGCGEGNWLQRFIHRAGIAPENVCGVDLLPERIAAARQNFPASVPLYCCDASHMPFPGNSFDLLISMTVFSSILDRNLRRAVASEMLRVLRPGGAIVWYDFRVNNPWNADVRRVSRPEIRSLFEGCRIDFQRVTLAPPLGRIVARSRWMYSALSRLRILSTHYLGWIQKP